MDAAAKALKDEANNRPSRLSANYLSAAAALCGMGRSVTTLTLQSIHVIVTFAPCGVKIDHVAKISGLFW